jgi:hypothetical protein
MTKGSLWKAEEKFVIQFDNVKPKDKKVILNSLQGWRESGSGFHRDGTEILIFSNKALDENVVRSIVKNMPFPFTEEKNNGTSKKIRTCYKAKKDGLTESQSRDKIAKGRACSKCGLKGHNSRTCKR